MVLLVVVEISSELVEETLNGFGDVASNTIVDAFPGSLNDGVDVLRIGGDLPYPSSVIKRAVSLLTNLSGFAGEPQWF